MDKKIIHALSKPLYPYLYGLAFIVYKISRYPPSFSLDIAIISFSFFCIITFLFKMLYRKVFKMRMAGIGIVLLWASLLHVTGVAQLFGYAYSYIPQSFYILFYLSVPLILFFVHLGLNKLPEQIEPKLNCVAGIFFLTISCIFLITAILKSDWRKDEDNLHKPFIVLQKDTSKQKDILWLLMDEYASSGSLQAQFGFENPLDSILLKKGFTILENTRSRFNNTLFSLNSILNDDDSLYPSTLYSGVKVLQKATWVMALEKSGYEFINFSFFDIGSQAKLADRSGYPYTFSQQLFSGTIFTILLGMKKYTITSCDDYNQHVFQKLETTLAVKSKKPRFIWAHLGIPHEPFCRNRYGKLLKDTNKSINDSSHIKNAYIEYVQYANLLLTDLIKKHPDILKEIVIISGDHGPRYPFLHNKEYQYWPFAAILMPPGFDTAQLHSLKYISQIPDQIDAYLNGQKSN